MSKHAGGRPLKFATVETLCKIADKFFEETPEEEWTITGLALALDTSREVLMDYQERDQFADAVKRYKLKIHYAYEKDLRRKGRSGDIFALKNFGWTDQQNIDHTTKGKEIRPILGGTTGHDLPSDDSDE
jgi:hypothetical protein